MNKPNGSVDPITGKINLSEYGRASFFSQIDKNSPNGCWLWTGNKRVKGYGQIRIGGKFIATHRLSWILHVGEIPTGLNVLHNCPGGDNPSCCNPLHLWLGTSADNTNDMIFKGREARGAKNGTHTCPESTPRGMRSGRAKLNDEKVREIRKRRAMGESVITLAKDFGVCFAVISCVARGKTWKHVS